VPTENSRRSKFFQLTESVQTFLIELADPDQRFDDWNPSRRSRAGQIVLLLLDHEDAQLISQLGERTYPDSFDVEDVAYHRLGIVNTFLEFARTEEDLKFFEHKLLRSGFLAGIVNGCGVDRFSEVMEALYRGRGAVQSPRQAFLDRQGGMLPRFDNARQMALRELLGASPAITFAEGVNRIYRAAASEPPEMNVEYRNSALVFWVKNWRFESASESRG
jgi:hypothetical protein